MNEKRKIEPDLDPDSPEARTRSDVAPKQKKESGAPTRHISGLRPAVHLPAAPSVPPAPLTPADLLEDGWDDDEDSGPTLLDRQGSVPRELVAEARAISDPIAEDDGETAEAETRDQREPETREVATREVTPRSFDNDEAPTGEMPTVQKSLAKEPDDDDEFSHDDFPTRQTPMGLQAALLAYPPPTDSHRGLHETLPAAEERTPDLPSTRSFASLPSFPSVAHVSPLASSLAAPMPPSPDETAQMPNAPALPRLLDESSHLSQPPPPAESSSISQVSQVSQISQVSHASQVARPLLYPTPTSISGTPLPPANTVRFAFLKNLSPNNDPPINRLVVVAAISFFATLVVSAFVAWVVVLVRH